jgi:hypothetical protein
MNIHTFVILTLVVIVVIISGCTQGPGPATPAPTLPTSEQTAVITQTTTIPSPQPSFTLGDHYLKGSYSFQSEKDVYVEQKRVDNASWGIGFDVLPLTENLTDSWFTMNVTNRDSGHRDTYGYGHTNGFELHHLIPMYSTGLYEIEMRGYLVKVDVILAKRNP